MNERIEAHTPQPTEQSVEETMLNEGIAKSLEISDLDVDASGEIQDTPPIKRRRVRTAAAVMVCLAFLVGIGIFASFFLRYYLADRASGHGNYEEAYERFTALNNFLDSLERAAEQYNLKRYAQAEELCRQEDFLNAYQMFRMLGDFQDAAQRAETALLMQDAVNNYDEAMRFYGEENDKSLIRAYGFFEEIKVENFRDTAERMESLLVKLDNLAVDYADRGYCFRVPEILDFLTQKGYPRAEQLRAEILAQEHIEPDDSYYNMDTSRISSFSGSTTREDFFTLWRYMYLTGTTKLYVPAARGGAASVSYVNQVLERMNQGYYLSEIILPEYPSIYDWYSEVYWDDSYDMMDYMCIYQVEQRLHG